MRVLLVCNPSAGRGKGKRSAETAARYLASRGARVDLVLSEGPGDLTAVASRFDPSVHERAIVCGGDGTLHHFVRGLPLEASILGILPSGSGDDLAATLGIPRNLQQACDVALGGKVRRIDVPTANSIRYLGVAGLGFDSEVARYANEKVKLLRGSLVYFWAILRVLPRFTPKLIELSTNDSKAREELMFAVVGNSHRYGGGILIAPAAIVDDGQLDLLVVRKCSRLNLLKTLPRAYTGRHVDSDFVAAQRGTEFHFDSEHRLDVFADGEYITQTPVRFEIGHEKLHVMVPHS